MLTYAAHSLVLLNPRHARLTLQAFFYKKKRISYRVNSEQNFANRLYDKIHLTKSPALAKEAVRRCRIPEYARADESQGELDPGAADVC